VCPFSPTRTFQNQSNLARHCNAKHNGFRPRAPPGGKPRKKKG